MRSKLKKNTEWLAGSNTIILIAVGLLLVSCATQIGTGDTQPQTADGSAEAAAAGPTLPPPTPSASPATLPNPTQVIQDGSQADAGSQVEADTAEPRAMIEAGNLLHLTALHTLEGHSDDVTDAAFSPDGSMLASSSKDGMIRLWDAEDGSLLRTLTGHTQSVLSIAFSPDGTLLVSGSDDRTARLWRVEDGMLLHTINNFTEGRVLRVAFSPDGSLFAMADHLCYVQLRRSGSGILYRILTQPQCAARLNGSVAAWGMEFSRDGETILTAEGQPQRGGSIQMWNVDGFSAPTLLAGYKMMVRDLSYSPDEAALAVALLGSPTFVVLDASDGRWLQEFEGHPYMVNSVGFSPDGSLIASGSLDRTIGLWQVDEGVLLYQLEGHRDSVNCVAFSPDGSLIASASDDDTVIIWGIPSP